MMLARRMPLAAAAVSVAALHIVSAAETPHRVFRTPEAAVQSLAEAVKAGNLSEVRAIFGPDGDELIESSDPATARQNQEIFVAAMAEGWRLTNSGTNRKTLVVGNEAWPFPVPIVISNGRWRFDTRAGKEEVLARRIGRNELEAISICRTYVAAQLQYARDGHDGKPAGLYAKTFRSDPGRQNGLFWSDARGQKRSPLGDLMAQAADERGSLREDQPRLPFHGYYFRILTAQGPHAQGGAKSFIVNGELSGGFALVAWPSTYDATGIMTFIVDQSGAVRQKDLGVQTDAQIREMAAFDPDASWIVVR